MLKNLQPVRDSFRIPRRHVALLLLVAGVLACATTPRGERTRRGPITTEELDSVEVSTLWEAIRILRPMWVVRNIGGAFLDGVPCSARDLELEPVSAIGEVRMITAEEATKYGVLALSGYFFDVKRRR